MSFFNKIFQDVKSSLNNYRNNQTDKKNETSTEIKVKQIGIETLADEVLINIFNFLSAKDLLALGLVNRRFGILSNDQQLWKGLYRSLGLNQSGASTEAKSLYFYALKKPKKEKSVTLDSYIGVKCFFDSHLENQILVYGEDCNTHSIHLLDSNISELGSSVWETVCGCLTATNNNLLFIFPYSEKKIFFLEKNLNDPTTHSLLLDNESSALAASDHFIATGSVGSVEVWKPMSATTEVPELLKNLYHNLRDKINKIVIENNFIAAISLNRAVVWNMESGQEILIVNQDSRTFIFEHLDLKNSMLCLGRRGGFVEIINCTSLDDKANIYCPLPSSEEFEEEKKDNTVNISQHSKRPPYWQEISYTVFLKGNIMITNEAETAIRFWDTKTKKCLYTFLLGSGFCEGPHQVDFQYDNIYDFYKTPKIKAVSFQKERMYLSIKASLHEQEERIEIWTLPMELIPQLF